MANMENKEQERVGLTGVNTYGSKMIIEKYNRNDDILVRFIETKNKVNTQWVHFCNGNVKNVYDKTVFGVGYIGEGKYVPYLGRNYTKQYASWISMLERCYSDAFKEKRPTYKECSVIEEWHSFQNFAKWYDNNFYQIEGERMELDKDILVKGNKVYSPKTCVFVPNKINALFIKSNASRGELPIGVHLRKDTLNTAYRARYSYNGKTKNLGNFRTVENAFIAYKTHKEKLIKQIADYYKDKIPSKLYKSLLNYKVEITD